MLQLVKIFVCVYARARLCACDMLRDSAGIEQDCLYVVSCVLYFQKIVSVLSVWISR